MCVAGGEIRLHVVDGPGPLAPTGGRLIIDKELRVLVRFDCKNQMTSLAARKLSALKGIGRSRLKNLAGGLRLRDRQAE